jgi:hypothetical protein
VLAATPERYGPFDRYLVDEVVKNPTSGAYAAIVTYHHGNSSADVHAIWLGDGQAPDPGSTGPLKGWPSLVSVSPIPAEQIAFATDHELVVTVPGPAEVSSDTDRCYFEAAGPNTICLDGAMIRVQTTK